MRRGRRPDAAPHSPIGSRRLAIYPALARRLRVDARYHIHHSRFPPACADFSADTGVPQVQPPTSASARRRRQARRPCLRRNAACLKARSAAYLDPVVAGRLMARARSLRHRRNSVRFLREFCRADAASTGYLLTQRGPSSAGRCGGENRQLIVEGTLVGRPRFAAGDIGGEVRILLQYARSGQPAQHRHHQ
jgi:hypothetical protein